MQKAMETQQVNSWMENSARIWKILRLVFFLGFIVYLWMKYCQELLGKSKDVEIIESGDIQLQDERGILSYKSDDLTKIRGIGKKVSQLLNGEGILTFEQLSNKTTEELAAILERNNLQFMNPSDWASQAKQHIN